MLSIIIDILLLNVENQCDVWVCSLVSSLKASFTSYKSVQQFCLYEVLWNVLTLFFEIWPFLRQHNIQLHFTQCYFWFVHTLSLKWMAHDKRVYSTSSNWRILFFLTAAASLWLVCKVADHTTYREYLCMQVWCILYANKYIFYVLYFPH